MTLKLELEATTELAEAFEVFAATHIPDMGLCRTSRKFSNPPVFRYVADSENPMDFYRLGLLAAQIIQKNAEIKTQAQV